MTSGGIVLPLIGFILPLIGSSVFQQLYSLISLTAAAYRYIYESLLHQVLIPAEDFLLRYLFGSLPAAKF